MGGRASKQAGQSAEKHAGASQPGQQQADRRQVNRARAPGRHTRRQQVGGRAASQPHLASQRSCSDFDESCNAARRLPPAINCMTSTSRCPCVQETMPAAVSHGCKHLAACHGHSAWLSIPPSGPRHTAAQCGHESNDAAQRPRATRTASLCRGPTQRPAGLKGRRNWKQHLLGCAADASWQVEISAMPCTTFAAICVSMECLAGLYLSRGQPAGRTLAATSMPDSLPKYTTAWAPSPSTVGRPSDPTTNCRRVGQWPKKARLQSRW